MSSSCQRYLSLFSLLLSLSVVSSHLGPLQAGERVAETPHYDDPSCVWFTLQDQLPAQTVQLITYGAPEVSVYLAMGLMGGQNSNSAEDPLNFTNFSGDQKTFPQAGQVVTAHYALYLDDCTFIESSRQYGTPFSFTFGAGEVIEGFERGVAQMSLGQRVSLTLSPDMGYGEEGAGEGTIPPNATLIFDLQIISIE